MTNYASNLTDVIGRKVSSVLRELLETKHLYQSVQIFEKDFNEVINSTIEQHKRETDIEKHFDALRVFNSILAK
jgi:hypothetical protein